MNRRQRVYKAILALHLPGYGLGNHGVTASLDVCPDCGAAVANTMLHDRFHVRLDLIDRDARRQFA